MSTTLSTFSESEATMRYKEPYLTEGLNKKLVVTPSGIYQGFRLAANGAALTVTVSADSTDADHIAAYQTQTGFSLTLRKTGGDFSLNLAAFASKTVVICLYATYAVGATTTAEIRGYELSPSDTFTGASENSELVVLGTVVVPASGVIAGGSITSDRRRSAWAAVATEASPWSPILKNGGFEHAITGDGSALSGTDHWAISDWTNRVDLSTNGYFYAGAVTVLSGAKSLSFFKTTTAVASVGRIEQHQEVPVNAGQLLRVVAHIRQLIALTGGSYTLNLYWGDADSVASSSTAITLSAAGTDASFRTVDTIVAVPAGKTFLKAISIEAVATTTASTGVAVVFDDVQVYAEVNSPLVRGAALANHLRQEVLGGVVLEDLLNYSLGQIAAAIRFDRTTPSGEGEVIIERRDQNASAPPPALALMGRIASIGSKLLGSAADARKSRLSSPYSASLAYTLLSEALPDSGTHPGLRFYGTSTGKLMLTVNASYDGTNWNKDLTGTAATQVIYDAGQTTWSFQISGTASWGDGSWVLALTLTAAGLVLPSNSNITLAGTGLVKTPNRGVAFALDFSDLIKNVGGSGYATAHGTRGGTLGSSGDAYFKIPSLSFNQRLQSVTIWANDSGGLGTATLYKYDETIGYTSASSSQLLTGAPTLTVTSPAANLGTVWAVRVEAGTNDVVIKKGEYLADVP